MAGVASKKLLLDLHRNLVQPFLGSVRPFMVIADFCLELPDPVFIGPKLSRQFINCSDRLLIVCLRGNGGSMKQVHGVMACSVKWVARFRPAIRFGRSAFLSYSCTAIAHRTSLWLGTISTKSAQVLVLNYDWCQQPSARSSTTKARSNRICHCAIREARWAPSDECSGPWQSGHYHDAFSRHRMAT